MGDWLHVDHCVVCADHATAVRLYERIERAGAAVDSTHDGPSGMLWGFWSPTVVLLSTTNKWGAYPHFVEPLIDGLAAQCFTASDDAERDSELTYNHFEAAVRERLGAHRDFLWSHDPKLMAPLLAELEPLATGLTTLALLPAGVTRPVLPRSVTAALAPQQYRAVVHGFTTARGACFAVGAFTSFDEARHDSPLWTPLAARRGRGHGAWALRALLDGNELLPVHGLTARDLWRIERHGGYGAWLHRPLRLARAQTLLRRDSAEERQAGCALARRWWLPELTTDVAGLVNDADAHVREAALFARDTLTADAARSEVEVDTGSDALAQAHSAGLAAHASGAPAAEVVACCRSVGELGAAVVARALPNDQLGQRLLTRLAELAYATTRTSYWMIRYGVPERDAPVGVDAIDQRTPWRGETGAKAARIAFWAARTVEAAALPFTRANVLRSFVTFDELLSACRDNGAFLIPPIGMIRADLAALLAEADDTEKAEAIPPGSDELAALEVRSRAIGTLLRSSDDETLSPELEAKSKDALEGVARSPLTIDPFSLYGSGAPRLIAWIANNLAWRMHLAGRSNEALAYAELAVAYCGWEDTAERDTLTQIRASVAARTPRETG